jgi:hypothetical protein
MALQMAAGAPRHGLTTRPRGNHRRRTVGRRTRTLLLPRPDIVRTPQPRPEADIASTPQPSLLADIGSMHQPVKAVDILINRPLSRAVAWRRRPAG